MTTKMYPHIIEGTISLKVELLDGRIEDFEKWNYVAVWILARFDYARENNNYSSIMILRYLFFQFV